MQTKLPHEIKSEETKQKILAATEQILSQYGFRFLTVRNICELSGAAYGSFYHHFSSKENLLFTYIADLCARNVENNPVPDWIDEGDYINRVLWQVNVLGCFCEAAGRDLIGYIYKNCPQELFDEVLRNKVLETLQEADAVGFIDVARNRANRKAIDLLAKDLGIVCRGTIMWWCQFADRDGEDAEPLHETLEHLCFNLLFAYRSDKFRSMVHLRSLLTEMPEFQGAIHIEGVPRAKMDS